MPRDDPAPARPAATGAVLLALAVFVGWGVFPSFFKLLVSVPPAEILAHRILWSALFMAGLLLATGRFPAVRDILADRRTLGLLMVSALLIAVNWLVYVGTVTSGHVLEASLGYFISPLANVALGRLVLGERLTVLQALACGLAALAVAGFALAVGPTVWRAVVLALSFGCYGLVRKLVRAEALPGFAVECFVLAPIAAGYLVLRWAEGAAPLDRPAGILALLALSGVLTALPLLGYAVAARKLRLSTLGLLNYVVPTIQFGLGVAVYGEPFDLARLGGFAVIWLALALYSIEMLRLTRRLQPR
jgi:chloramphenicol-sensitive protein RarD